MHKTRKSLDEQQKAESGFKKHEIKNFILELFMAYEIETEFDGQAINERNYNALANDIIKLFNIPDVSVNVVAVCNLMDCKCDYQEIVCKKYKTDCQCRTVKQTER